MCGLWLEGLLGAELVGNSGVLTFRDGFGGSWADGGMKLCQGGESLLFDSTLLSLEDISENGKVCSSKSTWREMYILFDEIS